MCGICGSVGIADTGAVSRMNAAMRHRGPDDDGAFSDGPAQIGMVRLSVIDLASGHQPIADEKRANWVVFNGEIYNYRALRSDLQARGHRFATLADTEVIVHLYEEGAERCVERLDGDFAFAIWDTERRRLFAARDRLGVKPLYYWQEGDRFAFASELKALLEVPGIRREVDPDALDAYLSYLYVPAPLTIFRGIHKLPAGCWMSFADGALRVERYWRPPAPVAPLKLSDAELESLVRDQIGASVRARLMSDVPLGAFLSGGIDSSAVVAFMSRAADRPVRTFSVGFGPGHPEFDESGAARIASEAFKTDHHALTVKPDVASVFPRVVWHMDEPFADSSSILTYLISRAARAHVTVALTGIGGDEVFGGYPRYLGAWASLAYERLPLALRRGLSGCAGVFPESAAGRNVSGWVRRFLREGSLAGPERYLAWRTYVTPAMKSMLYSTGLEQALSRSSARGAMVEALAGGEGHYLERIQRLDLETYLPDDLLAMADRMSMAHGLELRVPFCDHHMIEALAAVPLTRRMRGRRLKALLKDALKPLLPEPLLRKPKQGFMAPLGAWLRTDLRPLCDALLSRQSVARRGLFNPDAVQALKDRHMGGREELPHAIYALLVLELYLRLYVDGETSWL